MRRGAKRVVVWEVSLSTVHTEEVLKWGPFSKVKFSTSKQRNGTLWYIAEPLISARQHIAYILSALYAIACVRLSVCLVRPSVHLSVRHTGGSYKNG